MLPGYPLLENVSRFPGADPNQSRGHINPVPPFRLGKACCEASPSRLASSGGVVRAGVRPDSPSRSDTFLLLRMAARLRRGGRVGSYVVR